MMVEHYRKTKETEITIKLGKKTTFPDIDKGSVIDSGVPFFNHMLDAMLFRANMCADLKCFGDLEVDVHHTLEDVGIVMGDALKAIYTDMDGFARYACTTLPMDDALVRVALDVSGRPYFHLEGLVLDRLDALEQSMVEYLRTFSIEAKLTVHIDVLRGFNRHHIFEAIFKALGTALGEALDQRKTVQSTKGVIG